MKLTTPMPKPRATAAIPISRVSVHEPKVAKKLKLHVSTTPPKSPVHALASLLK